MRTSYFINNILYGSLSASVPASPRGHNSPYSRHELTSPDHSHNCLICPPVASGMALCPCSSVILRFRILKKFAPLRQCIGPDPQPFTGAASKQTDRSKWLRCVRHKHLTQLWSPSLAQASSHSEPPRGLSHLSQPPRRLRGALLFAHSLGRTREWARRRPGRRRSVGPFGCGRRPRCVNLPCPP